MPGDIKVAMSGLPGKMAARVAELVQQSRDLELLPFALTGSGRRGPCRINGLDVELIAAAHRGEFAARLGREKNVIVVDYSHPKGVDANVRFFVEQRLPFVLGTTGGDYGLFEKLVAESGLPCVIAPNMALPIVALTAMLRWGSEQFPGVFKGYNLVVNESHQSGKADTSGTAKALIALLQKLGAGFAPGQLHMCRDAESQVRDWGIPREHLGGHAYHTYDLRGHENTAHFSIQHNILGRTIYAEGTLEAARFLSRRLDKPVAHSYNMMDVLKYLEVG